MRLAWPLRSRASDAWDGGHRHGPELGCLRARVRVPQFSCQRRVLGTDAAAGVQRSSCEAVRTAF